ncbi:MAG TPA: DUF2065 domain-containing protein [Thiomicrospira sp.]|jgi:uncharacterized protein YjeT (DUF2065 family)|nr:DUF2065 domain-containing protein [Thiomicrospira sp.]
MLETTLLTAIALVFILEGLLPFIFPAGWKKMMSEAIKLSERDLRVMGLVSIIIGMAILLLFSE